MKFTEAPYRIVPPIYFGDTAKVALTLIPPWAQTAIQSSQALLQELLDSNGELDPIFTEEGIKQYCAKHIPQYLRAEALLTAMQERLFHAGSDGNSLPTTIIPRMISRSMDEPPVDGELERLEL